MEADDTSIFDKEFIRETWIRRRQLMPVALRMYVWFLLIITPVSLAARGWAHYKYSSFPNLTAVDWVELTLGAAGICLSIAHFLAALFLLLEKKWAVRFAILPTVATILLSGYSMVQMNLSGVVALVLIMNIVFLLLDLFFLLMLLRIRKDWETKALSRKGI
ncbi:hypothetical protein ACTJJ0_25625 [Chitinophaga sp. 22321]|uniref:Uncharacterized protein n=1 Tax=Chitinophaga hostae TaxID=2831022 RepID=A0ABS5J7P2_9BACT|nr:hypothetical protein [Chitinophaga hostae]MBS0030432.1 hypothetical protein [Chitinophaga hostae]